MRVTRVKGISERRRLPRLGVIRLGVKVQNKKGVEYPRETDHFVVPEEVQRVYGDQPKILEVMLPVNNVDAVFPNAYKMYGKQKGLICEGDGETGYWRNQDTNEIDEKKCPCAYLDTGDCKLTGTLLVMLPEVSIAGIYQITTRSYNSIIDINSGIDYISALCGGRFHLIPLILERQEIETHHEGRRQVHYTLRLTFKGNIDTVNLLRENRDRLMSHTEYLLPEPLDENPELDAPDIIENDEETPPLPEDPPPGSISRPEEPLITDEQFTIIKGLIGNQDLSEEDKNDCYGWLKENVANKIEFIGKEVITYRSAEDIINKFDYYYSDYLAYKAFEEEPREEDGGVILETKETAPTTVTEEGTQEQANLLDESEEKKNGFIWCYKDENKIPPEKCNRCKSKNKLKCEERRHFKKMMEEYKRLLKSSTYEGRLSRFTNKKDIDDSIKPEVFDEIMASMKEALDEQNAKDE